MRIDPVNWFEIAAAIVAAICWVARPVRSTAILLAVLLLTLSVEFTSKYWNQLYTETHNPTYSYAKKTMYSLFNIVKFCGTLCFIYLLLNNPSDKKIYITASLIIIAFVLGNLFIGQGYKIYNNYSAVIGIFILVGMALNALRKYEGEGLSQWQRSSVYWFLIIFIFFYTVNLPFFVFFQQMLAEDRSKAIQIYRIINDSANYVLYAGLVIAVLMHTFADRRSVTM